MTPKYFPETVTTLGNRTWDPPDILASHMADAVMNGEEDEDMVLPFVTQFSD